MDLSDIVTQPNVLAVAAMLGLGVLWREDRRVYRERIAELRSDLGIATNGWKAQTDANAVLVDENAALAAENAALARTNEANARALKALSTATASRARSDGARRRLADRP